MASQVDPIPHDRRGVIPYMAVADCASAIDFYTKVFGATETFRIEQPDGRIGHAELIIGGNVIYLCDEFPDHGTIGPLSVGVPLRVSVVPLNVRPAGSCPFAAKAVYGLLPPITRNV